MAILVLLSVLFLSLYIALPVKAQTPLLTVTDQNTGNNDHGINGDVLIFSGSGFSDDEDISIDCGSTHLADAHTDSSGAFSTSTTYTIIGVPHDSYDITASDSDGNSADSYFTVMPNIVLTPTWGPSGTLVTVDGTGFAADSTVSGTFGSTDIITSYGTDDSGSFTTTFNVPNLANEPYQVTVTDDFDSSVTAQTSFTISLVNPLPEYPIGALIGLIVCFATFALYMKRSSLSKLKLHI